MNWCIVKIMVLILVAPVVSMPGHGIFVSVSTHMYMMFNNNIKLEIYIICYLKLINLKSEYQIYINVFK